MPVASVYGNQQCAQIGTDSEYRECKLVRHFVTIQRTPLRTYLQNTEILFQRWY